MEERTSRSVWKIEVGSYKDGRKRYEYRHVNDLKMAHPKSLAAPVERPKLGRPAMTSSSDVHDQTDADAVNWKENPSNHFPSKRVPEPPVGNKQAAGPLNSGTSRSSGHATSTTEDPSPAFDPASGLTINGPPPKPAFSSTRPVRTTRNPNPIYVDSISCMWSASKSDLAAINSSISRSPGA